jgi:hypothetical protein
MSAMSHAFRVKIGARDGFRVKIGAKSRQPRSDVLKLSHVARSGEIDQNGEKVWQFRHSNVKAISE